MKTEAKDLAFLRFDTRLLALLFLLGCSSETSDPLTALPIERFVQDCMGAIQRIEPQVDRETYRLRRAVYPPGEVEKARIGRTPEQIMETEFSFTANNVYHRGLCVVEDGRVVIREMRRELPNSSGT